MSESKSPFESLAERFNTVAAFWHDAYAQWQVKVDPQRRTFDDCRYEGWGNTLDEAAMMDSGRGTPFQRRVSETTRLSSAPRLCSPKHQPNGVVSLVETKVSKDEEDQHGTDSS